MLHKLHTVLSAHRATRQLSHTLRQSSRPLSYSPRVTSQKPLNRPIVTSPKSSESPAHKDVYLEDLKSRGLYNQHILQHVKHTAISQADLSDGGHIVHVTWSDGHVSDFHAIWLRAACHCDKCRQSFNGKLLVDFDQVDEDIRVLDFRREGGGVVLVTWGDSRGEVVHQGPIPTAWLRQHCYSQTARDQRWRQRDMVFYQDKTIPQVEYTGESMSGA